MLNRRMTGSDLDFRRVALGIMRWVDSNEYKGGDKAGEEIQLGGSYKVLDYKCRKPRPWQ